MYQQIILGMLAMQTLFVIGGGSYLLWQRGTFARWRVKHSDVPLQRRRRARRVDQVALCRISRLMLHHQHRFAAEMHRETKPEMISLTEVRPVHDPQMLALAQLVRAKLVTQTAGLQTLYGVKAGENTAYQQRLAEFRAATAYLNLHEAGPMKVRRDTDARVATSA